MKELLIVAVCLLFGAGRGYAAPVTLNFDSLPTAPVLGGVISHGNSVVENGFVFNTGAAFGGFATWPSGNSSYTGSAALFANQSLAAISLTQQNGNPFAIASIALTFTNLAQPGSQLVTFLGTKTDSSTVQQSFAVSAATQTFSFSSAFTGLTSLDWSQDSSNNHQFDNLVVDGDVAAVSAPATGALLAIVLAGLAVRRRHGARGGVRRAL